MKLNLVEKVAMNNPVRAWIQRHVEVPRLLALGESPGGRVLEVGCGRGQGVLLARAFFGACQVDAFDLDPDMVRRARRRTAHLEGVRLWEGSVSSIPAEDDTYDAVLDFGILHHVTQWREALVEIGRVLRPGGRLFAEEVLAPFVDHWAVRRLTDHPRSASLIDDAAFREGLEEAGLTVVGWSLLGSLVGWYVADKVGAT